MCMLLMSIPNSSDPEAWERFRAKAGSAPVMNAW